MDILTAHSCVFVSTGSRRDVTTFIGSDVNICAIKMYPPIHNRPSKEIKSARKP